MEGFDPSSQGVIHDYDLRYDLRANNCDSTTAWRATQPPYDRTFKITDFFFLTVLFYFVELVGLYGTMWYNHSIQS